MRSTVSHGSKKPYLFALLQSHAKLAQYLLKNINVRLTIALCCPILANAQSALTITTPNVPPAAVGSQYTQQFAATGGTPPYAWSVSGALPPGLSFTTSGLLSGAPSKAGTYQFSVTVLDANRTSAASSLSMVVYSGFAITTASPLPAGNVGQTYGPVTLTAAGGVAPVTWAVGPGLPPGLSVSPSGSISGTPTSGGAFSFTLQATDSAQDTSAGTFTLTITSSPLAIATIGPLFSGVVGQPYAQTLSASGGKPPYTWSVSGTLPSGLSLNNSAGTISGTPTAAGTSNFTVQVTDSASASAQQAFSITVNPPSLTLSILSSLPPAKVGVSYSQKLPVSAGGGTAPYTWALKSGSVPGLSFDPVSVALAGTPLTAGTFNLAIQVSDATGLSATATVTFTVNAASLAITTTASLPDAALNAPYTQTLAASGGIPPYTWSATGLPAGLTLGASSGILSGIPSAAGSFAIAITVQDTSLSSYSNRFTLNVNLPPAPGITLSGLPATAAPAQQYTLTVALAGTYPADITGQLLLTFSPDTGPADETIQFASGGATETFTIPTGSTTAIASAPLALQTGTVSGTLTVSLRLQAGGVDITPSPAPSVSTQIAAAAPVITNLQSSVSGNTLNIVVTGYATSRDMMQAVFAFSAAAGQSLQSTASSITIDVSTLFDQWFASTSSAQFGTEFIFTQPFSIQGSAGSVMPVSVTLVNRIGQTTSHF